MTFYSDPEGLVDYAIFSSSEENGTVIETDETLPLILYLTTFSNPGNVTGEIYVRIYGEPS